MFANILKPVIIAVLFSLFSVSTFAQKYTISGYVKDQDSGESLIGANIFDVGTKSGTSTNYYGFYSITLPADAVKLMFSYTGYDQQQFDFHLQKDTVIHINLKGSLLAEVEVRADRNSEPIQEQSQMSAITVPIAQIKALPALFGEVDVFKVLQLLPGVQSGQEGSSGMYVRGGGPDQNLVLLDGVPVYNAAHLFGFFSVFNADAINHVELIKGGFPARYGGRLSSVIDINMKEGNSQRFKGEGSIGIIASKLTLEGPLDDKSTFIISGRRTYIDVLARPFLKAEMNGGMAGYYFYDLNAKLNRKLSEKDRIYLSAYMGKDRAYLREVGERASQINTTQISDEAGIEWGNLTSAFRWNHIFNNKLFSNTTLTYSRYNFNLGTDYKSVVTQGEGEDSQFMAKYFSGIEDVAAKIDFDYIPSPDHYIRYGLNAIHHNFTPGASHILNPDLGDTLVNAFQTRGIEASGYIEDDFKINDRLKINMGLHFSSFLVNGKTYPSIQPRFSGRYLIKPDLALKASYANMRQFIHLLTNSGIGLPTDLWVPATDRIAPQHSNQVALGLAKNINRYYELSIEGYYKDMRNVIEYKEGASFEDVHQSWEDKVEVGIGRSYGAEFFVQKKHGSLSGWVGYTLSWTDRQFENINRGERFAYRYDRRHDLSVVMVQRLSPRIDFSATWVYGTGNAVTLPLGENKRASIPYSYDSRNINETLEHYEGRNSFRMRAFHRLDFSVNFKKVTRWGERNWAVGAYNAYSRQNPFFMSLAYNAERGAYHYTQYSLFPILPSVTYGFKF